MQAYLKNHASGLAKEELERLQDEQQMNGALAFRVMQSNGGKWNYVGAGVRRGDAERPVLWYKPQDSGKCRVVFGDLSVRELDAGELPMQGPQTE